MTLPAVREHPCIQYPKGQTVSTTFDEPIAVTATDRVSMERRLDEAVAIAMNQAMHTGRRGILITRHSYDFFTVALSHDVPFGLTRERTAWSDDMKKPRIGARPKANTA